MWETYPGYAFSFLTSFRKCNFKEKCKKRLLIAKPHWFCVDYKDVKRTNSYRLSTHHLHLPTASAQHQQRERLGLGTVGCARPFLCPSLPCVPWFPCVLPGKLLAISWLIFLCAPWGSRSFKNQTYKGRNSQVSLLEKLSGGFALLCSKCSCILQAAGAAELHKAEIRLRASPAFRHPWLPAASITHPLYILGLWRGVLS